MDNIEHILSICSTIYKMAENVKANKERCQRVAQRVKALEELVLTIKQRGPGQISATVENALREFCITVEGAKEIMMKYSKTKAVMSFLKSGSHEEKFCKVNERLNDNFQVLSGALQIEQGNILSKVYETVSGRRQDEECYSGQAPTSPTAPMPLPSIMPPTPVSSPTTPMPLPSIMPPMQMSNPTTPMALPSIMPPTPVSSPTAPMALPSTMPPMQMVSPTTPMPLPRTMPPMQMVSPTTSMPVSYIMSPMPVYSATSAMPVRGTVAPICYSTTIGPRPVHRIIAPAQAPFARMTKNTYVIRSYMVSNSNFP
ncbi:gibberellin-regulated protein 14-like [Siniperca chuatsi]|uniref:gibberellin-regulated protein 14-like n=1 Tax=Siniperca chuatsi TaxID=119488 RepID=UPI001CE0D759|nr:gibberellin-regulated protein 14-like [Siniperca chuatsi]XP_044050274.1 gibberellin-regulated protein 14-like [Siniperca chuatsi]